LGNGGRAEADLDAWVLASAPRAVAYATSLLRDPVQAEDVVQDCFCRLLRHRDTYDLPRDGVKLLFRAITNACINLKRRGRHLLSLDALGDAEEGAGWEAPDKSVAPPDKNALHRELEEAVAAGLAQLPVPQRAALELKSLGHSQQEVGECLGISANHAGVLIHRARQALTVLLAPYFDEARHECP
jgi:RNA polymerase sigma-70 factor (ECF subfamily)